jgi:WD40 repeat protein
VSVFANSDGKGRSSVRIYDLEADKLLHSIDTGVGFSLPFFIPDGKHILVVTQTSIKTYDVASGALQHDVPQQNASSSPTLSGDGKLMAFLVRGRENKSSIHFYDVGAAKMLPHTVDTDAMLFFAQFAPDNRHLVAFGPQKPVMFIDATTGKSLPPLKGWNGGAMTVAVSPNSRRLVLGTPEPALRMWDIPSREEIMPATGRAGPVLFTATEGDRAVWAGSTEHDGGKVISVLRRWDLPRGEPILLRDVNAPAAIWAHDRHHHVLAYPHQISEGGNTAMTVKVIHSGSGRDVTTFPALPGGTWISALAFTPDGKSLACATQMRRENVNKSAIIFRDATTGAEQFQISERPEQVHGLFFSRNGKVLAALGRDNHLKLFDVGTHEEKKVPPAPGVTTNISSVAWGPETRLIATGSYINPDQHTIRVWEPGTGKVLHRFPGKSAVTALAFRHDGTAIASSDFEGNLTVWNLANEKPIRQWHLPGPAMSLRFSHDGRYLISGNGNGTVYVFHIDSGPAPKP